MSGICAFYGICVAILTFYSPKSLFLCIVPQARTLTADASPMYAQTFKDNYSKPLRCHIGPPSGRGTQTVFPQNPTAGQRHSESNLTRGVGP